MLHFYGNFLEHAVGSLEPFSEIEWRTGINFFFIIDLLVFCCCCFIKLNYFFYQIKIKSFFLLFDKK